jgi:hypothetical protein
MLLSISRVIKKGPSVSAKGAHPLYSLGHRPRFSESEAVSAESATHLVASIESRFQRLPYGPIDYLGQCPPSKADVAPLALARRQDCLRHETSERYIT